MHQQGKSFWVLAIVVFTLVSPAVSALASPAAFVLVSPAAFAMFSPAVFAMASPAAVGSSSPPLIEAVATDEPIREQDTVRVLIETELGAIEVELDAARAPGTVANFLRYVDEGRYDGGRFHRSVRLDNQARDDVLIEVIQAGGNPDLRRQQFDPIPLERTRDTGLLHLDGTLSMARVGPDSARSDFFICIGEQPSLDFGGERNADGQGFAAFGRVVRGMDVARQIHQSSTSSGESLTPPVAIVRLSRID